MEPHNKDRIKFIDVESKLKLGIEHLAGLFGYMWEEYIRILTEAHKMGNGFHYRGLILFELQKEMDGVRLLSQANCICYTTKQALKRTPDISRESQDLIEQHEQNQRLSIILPYDSGSSYDLENETIMVQWLLALEAENFFKYAPATVPSKLN